ncbi:MAG TPA: septum formation initiator family protein [Gaiellaceae bacterium]|nr:septum formation initiator family protein [Gaiellaceae bacterium]
MPAKRVRRRTHARPFVARRWVALAALALVALLYYRPLRAYVDARGQQAAQAAVVRRLQAEQHWLEQRLKRSSSLPVLAEKARSLGYVRPGEHLYIVKNLPKWRRKQHASRRAHR